MIIYSNIYIVYLVYLVYLFTYTSNMILHTTFYTVSLRLCARFLRRERQRRQLASSLFGHETTQLSAVLHQLALFADPPQFPEPWMKTALKRIGQLVSLSDPFRKT